MDTEAATFKERPILFKGRLVRGILEGRKRATRRILNPQPWSVVDGLAWRLGAHIVAVTGGGPPPELMCPHGQPGDRLYVRETFCVMWKQEHECSCEPHPVGLCKLHETVEYRADTGNSLPGEWPEDQRGDPEAPRWKPSIHMHRWASRIDLEIVSVRAERLQDITVEDIIAEGVSIPDVDYTVPERPDVLDAERRLFARDKWATLWDSINGKRGPKDDPGAYTWDRDPWVWRIEFRVI